MNCSSPWAAARCSSRCTLPSFFQPFFSTIFGFVFFAFLVVFGLPGDPQSPCPRMIVMSGVVVGYQLRPPILRPLDEV